jgi:hypothetical protein
MSDGTGSGGGYGCALWLSATAIGNTNLLLTIHNTLPFQSYAVSNLHDLRLNNWTLVTNVMPRSFGCQIDLLLPLDTRSNAFFRAFGLSACDTNFAFTALTHWSNGVEVTRAITPDSMGAVGLTYITELLNGIIAVFDKCGNRISLAYTKDFFAMTNAAGLTYPRAATIDGRIQYDIRSNRWIACAIDPDPDSKEVMLAVSKSEDPSNLTTGWSRYLVEVAQAGGVDTDSTSMGHDANGV